MKSQKGGLDLTLQEAGSHGNFFNGNDDNERDWERKRLACFDWEGRGRWGCTLRCEGRLRGIAVSLKRGMCE